MPLFERQAKNPGAGNALDLFGDPRHALLGFGCPADGLLGTDIQPRHLETRRQEDVAGRAAEAVLDIAAEGGLLLRTVDANSSEHEQPRIGLARVVDDLLERLFLVKGVFFFAPP